jgi:hypothetical protein
MLRSFWRPRPPRSGVASYVNFTSEFEEDQIRASRGAEKYRRLRQIKAKYDPANLLHLNGNMRPATSIAARPISDVLGAPHSSSVGPLDEYLIGDLKLFEVITMRLFVTLRDHGG